MQNQPPRRLGASRVLRLGGAGVFQEGEGEPEAEAAES